MPEQAVSMKRPSWDITLGELREIDRLVRLVLQINIWEYLRILRIYENIGEYWRVFAWSWCTCWCCRWIFENIGRLALSCFTSWHQVEIKVKVFAQMINQDFAENYLLRFATPSILAQMTLLMPMGEIHMMPLTIFMITSSMTWVSIFRERLKRIASTLKKVMTDSALRPMEPRTVPNVRQKKMIPRVLVPPLVSRIVVSNLIREIQVVDKMCLYLRCLKA